MMRSPSRRPADSVRHLTATFLRGLGVVLPVALTAWIIVWLATATESLLKPFFEFLLPPQYYLPGLGLLSGVLLVLAVGVLVQLFVVRRLWEAMERLLERIPLVKTLYAAISDFLDFFSRPPSEGSTVVSVDVGQDALLIGFITDEAPARTLNFSNDRDRVAVYLPMSYQVGGYTLMVPRDRVTELDLDVADAMRLVLTAGIQSRD